MQRHALGGRADTGVVLRADKIAKVGGIRPWPASAHLLSRSAAALKLCFGSPKASRSLPELETPNPPPERVFSFSPPSGFSATGGETIGGPDYNESRVSALSPKETSMEPEQVQDALRRRYAAVAERPAGQFNYPVGRDSAMRLTTAATCWTASRPTSFPRFVRVGNPFSTGEPQPGWNVLDVGCGSAGLWRPGTSARRGESVAST